jgi:hypothetical protein
MPQVDPGLKMVTHPLLATRKSPLSNTRSIVTLKSLVLVTCMVTFPLVAPTVVSGNDREGGSIERVAVGVTPVPVREKLCVPAGVLSASVTAPVRVPATVGVNVTLTPHEAPGFKASTHPVAA